MAVAAGSSGPAREHVRRQDRGAHDEDDDAPALDQRLAEWRRRPCDRRRDARAGAVQRIRHRAVRVGPGHAAVGRRPEPRVHRPPVDGLHDVAGLEARGRSVDRVDPDPVARPTPRRRRRPDRRPTGSRGARRRTAPSRPSRSRAGARSRASVPGRPGARRQSRKPWHHPFGRAAEPAPPCAVWAVPVPRLQGTRTPCLPRPALLVLTIALALVALVAQACAITGTVTGARSWTVGGADSEGNSSTTQVNDHSGRVKDLEVDPADAEPGPAVVAVPGEPERPRRDVERRRLRRPDHHRHRRRRRGPRRHGPDAPDRPALRRDRDPDVLRLEFDQPIPPGTVAVRQ